MKCLKCRIEFIEWDNYSKYCSRSCYWESLKNSIPWNKGLKGKQIAWNKGQKCPQISKGKKIYYLTHESPLKGIKRSKEICEKISKAKIGYIVSEEMKRKLRILNLGKHHSKETRRKISNTLKRKIDLNSKHLFKNGNIPWNKGKHLFKKGIVPWNKGKKCPELSGINHPNFGKKGLWKHTEEWKKQAGERSKRRWKNEEFIKKMQKSRWARPTTLELDLKRFLDEKYPKEWKYVGDFSFFIENKNPDFINCNGKKICIEVYAKYFKIKNYGSIENWKNERENIFLKYGFKTIFIEHDDFYKDKNNIKNIIDKVIQQ